MAATSVDSRLLIKQIEARPPLWNRDDKDYCQKQIISKLWAEIALVHGVHESKVRSRWKALRDTFRQELKKNPRQSSWGYYLDMQFLRGQLKSLPPKLKKVGSDEESGDGTLVKMEPEDGGFLGLSEEGDGEGGDLGSASLNEPDSSHECGMTDVDDDDDGENENENENEQEEEGNDDDDDDGDDEDDDDDLHFLLSLLPEMRRLQPKQKLPVRIKIMELIYDEAYSQRV